MKILLPVDGSELSLKAVRLAVDLLRQGLSGTLVLANVQEPATLYEMVVAPDGEVLRRVATAAGVDALQAAEALVLAEGVVYEREVATGDPAHMLVEIGERFGCDMIIMGARGIGAMRSALLGSVSQEVLHAAQVPVVIVKPDQD
ncbi:MAG: universal stress protein [Rhodoferax sp.]|nr:universal stress protein [Rhodoferax sp.]